MGLVKIDDDTVCTCGHKAFEHDRTATGYGECEVRGCVCFHFEPDDEDESGE